MKNIALILTLLVAFVAPQFDLSANTANRYNVLAVNPDSPRAAKITVTRRYAADTRENHPQLMEITAWYDSDNNCLAWSRYWKYEPQDYTSKKWLPTSVTADTIQANYSAAPVEYPIVEQAFFRGFELQHYFTDAEPSDSHGNWLVAYTKEYTHEGDYIERKIEYLGQESEQTKSEIAYFLNIRDNGLQNNHDALTLAERTNLNLISGHRKFVTIFTVFFGIIGVICALIFWSRYLRWNRIVSQPGNDPYNKSSHILWLLSAIGIYCISVSLTGLPVFNEYLLIVSVALQVLFAVFVLFKGLPAIAKMLLYGRLIGYWGSMILLLINLVAVWRLISNALDILIIPFLGSILAIVVVFFVGLRYFWDQAYKCPQCHAYDGTRLVGVLDGGFMKDNSQNRNEERYVDGLDIVTKTTDSKRTDYYRREVHLFHCPECGAQWKRTVRGGYAGSDVRKKVKEERERI